MERGKKIVLATGLTALLGLTIVGVASAAKKKKDKPVEGDCPDGFHWEASGRLGVPGRCVADSDVPDEDRRCAAGLRFDWRLNKCIPIKCPKGTKRSVETGQCVDVSEPTEVVCPEGSKWDPETEQCIEKIEECPPDQIYNLATGSCRPRCGEGQRWSPGLGRCVDVGPIEQDCPEGSRWVPAPYGPGGSCIPIEQPQECPDGSHWVPAPFGPGGSCIPDDVDFDIDDYIKNYPTPNSIYQMKFGDIMGWGIGSNKRTDAVTQNMLGSALFLAAREFGKLDDTQALAWANARRRNGGLTNMLYNAIVCCAWNDLLYGTWGYCGDDAIESGRCPQTMENHPGKHGRAIRPLTQHADNILRLKQGLAPARTVSKGTPEDKGDGRSRAVEAASPGGDDSFPALWLPGVNLKRLWESNGQDLQFVSDQSLPPDPIWDRGIENLSGSEFTTAGCNTDGYQGQVEI